MENVYKLFQAKKREVSRVIEDILTQRAQFTHDPSEKCRLQPSPSWLLDKLEDLHKKRTGAAVDLSRDPLLLILELSAYYYDIAKKAHSSVTSDDGFLAELNGAQKGVALIDAYTSWYTERDQSVSTDTTLRLRDPKELTEMREQFKLNCAADLATQFEDSRKFGPFSG